MSARFDTKFAFAHEVEKAVGVWLMKRGQKILPVYDYCGVGRNKAPMLTAAKASDSLVTPDLLGIANGRTIWFEVKYKDHADWTRDTRQLEAGINRRHWFDYEKVERESGCPVWILFAVKKQAEIRGGSLSQLRANGVRPYTGKKMGPDGMVFFPYLKMIRLEEKLRDVAPFVFEEELTCA